MKNVITLIHCNHKITGSVFGRLLTSVTQNYGKIIDFLISLSTDQPSQPSNSSYHYISIGHLDSLSFTGCSSLFMSNIYSKSTHLIYVKCYHSSNLRSKGFGKRSFTKATCDKNGTSFIKYLTTITEQETAPEKTSRDATKYSPSLLHTSINGTPFLKIALLKFFSDKKMRFSILNLFPFLDTGKRFSNLTVILKDLLCLISHGKEKKDKRYTCSTYLWINDPKNTFYFSLYKSTKYSKFTSVVLC
ncbi:hypothetical protein AGLY_015778 [Aphis glycines]|uniref:Uncharacterized protein n=1 Tax=Aphis glycines TaxID=307491 RepID=A0A6G0SZR6_APHGL|nr:hypothetical protein AGLY_015778 [Aphis glycines]